MAPTSPAQESPATNAAAAARTQGQLHPREALWDLPQLSHLRSPSLPHTGSVQGLVGAQRPRVPLCFPAQLLCPRSSAVSVSPLVQAWRHKPPPEAAGDRPEELSHLLVRASRDAGLAWQAAPRLPSTGGSGQGTLLSPAPHSLA